MPYRTLTDEELVRLVTARFMPGRFKGRQALEADAVKGDVVALAKLEIELGLANKSTLRQAYESHLHKALRDSGHYRHGISKEAWERLAQVPQGKRVPWILGMIARHEDVSDPERLVPPEEIKRILELQQSRADEPRYGGQAFQRESKIAQRIQHRLNIAMARTHWARWHYYRNRIEVVPQGQERVESENYPSWVRERVGSGWGNSYKSEEVFKMDKRHRWYLSTAMLNPVTVERQLKNRRGVYLTPNTRVRRGRDGSMITEVFNSTQSSFPWGQEVPRWIRRKS